MKVQLAIMTEWAWSQHALASPEMRTMFAEAFAQSLRLKYAHGAGCPKTGVAEILADLEIVYKRLSYGGRTPAQIHPQRLEALRRTIFATQ